MTGPRIWLDVPFAEKDQAKALGARWDPAERRSYAAPGRAAQLGRWAALPDLPDLLPGEDRDYGQGGLFVQPTPATVWWTHARSCIAPRDWERVRRMVTGRAGCRCEACGQAERPDAGIRLETHERWQFDTATRTQRLRRLICLDSACHTVTHFGLAQLRGVADEAFAHLCAVTGMTTAEGNQHLDAAVTLWRQQSEIEWDLDLGILTSAGIQIVQPAGSAADRAQVSARRTAEKRHDQAPGTERRSPRDTRIVGAYEAPAIYTRDPGEDQDDEDEDEDEAPPAGTSTVETASPSPRTTACHRG